MPDSSLSLIVGPAAFAAGLVIGSFLNVVILRGVQGRSLGGRSRCDACGIILGLRELIPAVSYFVQKGRCRACGVRFSFQHPIVEIATGIVFAALALAFLRGSLPYTPVFASAAFASAAAVIVLIVSDFRFQILPDGAVAVLGLSAVVISISRGHVAADFAAAAAAAAFFGGLWFFSAGKWMGFGDVKLVFATSLAVGFPASLTAFLFSFWLGGITGVSLIAAGRKGMQSRLPFGPFLIAGAVCAYFLSPAFLSLIGLAGLTGFSF